MRWHWAWAGASAALVLGCTPVAAPILECMTGGSQVIAGSCVINGECYTQGQSVPGNACQVCDPAATQVAAVNRECGEGLTCEPGSGECTAASGDAVVCMPCAADAECQGVAVEGRCAAGIGGVGSYCTLPCAKAADCLEGYACESVGSGNDAPMLCVPSSGACTCTQYHVEEAGSTPCGSGGCATAGVRSCVTAGGPPSACTAVADPAACPAVDHGASSCQESDGSFECVLVCEAGYAVVAGACVSETPPECATAEDCKAGTACQDAACDQDGRCVYSPKPDGTALPCPYGGAPQTEGVGACQAGARACAGGELGDCAGEVLPAAEECGDAMDSDCDGKPDAQDPSCMLGWGGLRLGGVTHLEATLGGGEHLRLHVGGWVPGEPAVGSQTKVMLGLMPAPKAGDP